MRSSSLHQSLVSTKLIEREKAAVKLKCKFYANIDLDFSFDSLFSSLVERDRKSRFFFAFHIEQTNLVRNQVCGRRAHQHDIKYVDN